MGVFVGVLGRWRPYYWNHALLFTHIHPHTLLPPLLFSLPHPHTPDAVGEFSKRRLPVRKVESSKPDRVKIDTCLYMANLLAILGYNKDWLVQYPDNVTRVGSNDAGGMISQ